MIRTGCATLALIVITCVSAGAQDTHQSALTPAKAEAAKKYPHIVLYSTAWCPHCRATKEYLTKNNIPFMNRDVEVDAGAMEELTGKYNSNGVPVIVFGKGKNEIVMKGFTPELFQKNLQKAHTK
ncbi:MAG: glutaredoxin domain-containing protein [Desulfuromonadaceae bacterium]|nr:glutaredoxin domain-containing protein [Desulfuromonadaceae bacterium]